MNLQFTGKCQRGEIERLQQDHVKLFKRLSFNHLQTKLANKNMLLLSRLFSSKKLLYLHLKDAVKLLLFIKNLGDISSPAYTTAPSVTYCRCCKALRMCKRAQKMMPRMLLNGLSLHLRISAVHKAGFSMSGR